jgi:hypothetical protein
MLVNHFNFHNVGFISADLPENLLMPIKAEIEQIKSKFENHKKINHT